MKPLSSLFALAVSALTLSAPPLWAGGPLRIAPDGRSFQKADGTPFFWLGDTAWLITQKLNREEVKTYFENRRAKGFNVVQVCVLQFLNDKSFNGSPAVLANDISKLALSSGSDPADPAQYDYWDHVDYVVETAAANDIYLAIAPVWSHMVRRTPLSAAQVLPYIEALAARYKDRPNIIWLNGGSARGQENAEVWQVIGETLQRQNPQQLVSFHPFGRCVTTEWFEDAAWIDFHLFTSGHRRYDQDTQGRQYGEDNWRYVLEASAADPRRPVLDAVPAYENTPQGLHDPSQPYWSAADSRRYAWWSVFAGAAGHTFGENSVRQVYIPSEARPASGAKGFIMERLETDGANQMRHVKDFILSRPSGGRINDQSILVGGEGERYDRILVARGEKWIAAYTYTGRSFSLHLAKTALTALKSSWLNPRTGEAIAIGMHRGSETVAFDPPGEPAPGNDWVLVLDDASREAAAAGGASVAAPLRDSTKATLQWGGDLLGRKPAWYGTAEARAAADTVSSYQSSVGAWPKNVDLLVPPTAEALRIVESGGKANTIDNGATTVPITFLAQVATATGESRYRDAVLRGVDYLLASQYENGGFPQFFPLREGYYAHITYNDGAMINALTLLREVAQARPPFAFVDEGRRRRAADAVARGIDCILETQIVQDGKPTAWCAQHDEVSLAPAWARAYEPPSLSGSESVGVVGFLMAIPSPSPAIVAAIEGAVAWLRAVSIAGHRVERVRRADGRTERVLVADPASPPLWARFYELGTNRPLYMDRDSQPVYDFAQINYERRSGYNYHTTAPARLLERDYPEWRARMRATEQRPSPAQP